MQESLSSLVDNLSEINKKNRWMNLLITLDLSWLHYHVFLMIYLKLIKKIRKLENKFIDNLRSMSSSLSCLVDDLSEINKKDPG